MNRIWNKLPYILLIYELDVKTMQFNLIQAVQENISYLFILC